jgi:hypothetical protein
LPDGNGLDELPLALPATTVGRAEVLVLIIAIVAEADVVTVREGVVTGGGGRGVLSAGVVVVAG